VAAKELKISKGVSLTPSLLKQAEERARKADSNFSVYVCRLIEEDLARGESAAGSVGPVNQFESSLLRLVREGLREAGSGKLAALGTLSDLPLAGEGEQAPYGGRRLPRSCG